MIKKNLLIILLFIFVIACDYTPMYSQKNINNFYIEKINYSGDFEVNNLINNKLKKYQNNINGKSFIISVKSDYNKTSLSKNLLGKTTDYKMIIKVTFEIKNNDLSKSFVLEENFILKNLNNKFEESKYEKIKKENLTQLIVNKLIIQLSRI